MTTYIDRLEFFTLVDVDAVGNRRDMHLVKVNLDLADQTCLFWPRFGVLNLRRIFQALFLPLRTIHN